jgi:hypothetical protein
MPIRKPADPSARLALLRPALKQVKRGEKLNADDMAKVAQMTWRNMKLTIDKDADFPIDFRGGPGIAWVFDAAKVLKHLIVQCEKAIADRGIKAARMARLSGQPAEYADQGPADSGEAPLAPNELKLLFDSQMVSHKLKEAQKKFMPRDATLAFLMDYHSQMQTETLGLLGKIDPAGQWPADVRKAVEDTMRSLLLNLQANMERFTAAHRASAAT